MKQKYRYVEWPYTTVDSETLIAPIEHIAIINKPT